MRHVKRQVGLSWLPMDAVVVARAILEAIGSFPVTGSRLDSQYNSKTEGTGTVDVRRVMGVRSAGGRRAVSWPRGRLFR